jgi:hypothetical protein
VIETAIPSCAFSDHLVWALSYRHFRGRLLKGFLDGGPKNRGKKKRKRSPFANAPENNIRKTKKLPIIFFLGRKSVSFSLQKNSRFYSAVLISSGGPWSYLEVPMDILF